MANARQPHLSSRPSTALSLNPAGTLDFADVPLGDTTTRFLCWTGAKLAFLLQARRHPLPGRPLDFFIATCLHLLWPATFFLDTFITVCILVNARSATSYLQLFFTFDLLHVHYSMGLDVVHDVDKELLQEDGRKDNLAQLFDPLCELAQ